MAERFNLKGIDLNLLTVFEAIMDTGQLSKAGAQVGLSQPAMSAALQRLRITLKDPLFVRCGGGMVPTPRATEWYAELAPALGQIRKSLSPQQIEPSQSDRGFSLLGGDYFETVHLAALLERLETEAPMVSVTVLPILADGLPADFKQGQNDFAIYYQPPAGAGVESQPVGTESLAVICRRDHPRIKGEINVAQFGAERHVLVSTHNQRSALLNGVLGRQGVERQMLARVSDFSSAAMVVENTEALCTVPAAMGAFLESRFAVKSLVFPLPVPPIDKLLIWPRVLAEDPLHRWFKEILIETMTG